MNTWIHRIILLVSCFLLFIILLSPFSYAQSTQSNCVTTQIGNPPRAVTLPASCGGASATALSVVELAKKQVGKPYIWGSPSRTWGSDKNPSGFDCSGLVGWAWYWGSNGKVNAPGTTESAWGSTPSGFVKHPPQDPLQPGDLIYFSQYGDVHHVVLYAGNNQIVEAYDFGIPVRITSWSSYPIRNQYIGFLRPTVK